MGSLRILKSGPMITIQDEGRFGFRRYGIPQSGAMDRQSFHNANILVGNPQDFPAIELAMTDLHLECLDQIVGACTGAHTDIFLNEEAVEMNNLFKASKGDRLRINRSIDANYNYLAIRGKMDLKEVFGSFSTYLPAGFGGLNGTALQAGDVLKFTTIEPIAFTEFDVLQDSEQSSIRIMKGPEWSLLKELPTEKEFVIHPSSNRMGIRLTGDALSVDGSEIVSSAVVPGTIQLPPNGLPIVLMNDCQTTGGYPRIAKVLDQDLGKLAQKVPGSKITFRL